MKRLFLLTVLLSVAALLTAAELDMNRPMTFPLNYETAAPVLEGLWSMKRVYVNGRTLPNTPAARLDFQGDKVYFLEDLNRNGLFEQEEVAELVYTFETDLDKGSFQFRFTETGMTGVLARQDDNFYFLMSISNAEGDELIFVYNRMEIPVGS